MSRVTLTPSNVKKALDIVGSSIPNHIFGGANLMVEASWALARGKVVMEQKAYAPFNLTNFSLPVSFTKVERIQDEEVFNNQSQLDPMESWEISAKERGKATITKGTTPHLTPQIRMKSQKGIGPKARNRWGPLLLLPGIFMFL